MIITTDGGATFTPAEVFLEVDHAYRVVHITVQGTFVSPAECGPRTVEVYTAVTFNLLRLNPPGLPHVILESLRIDLEDL